MPRIGSRELWPRYLARGSRPARLMIAALWCVLLTMRVIAALVMVSATVMMAIRVYGMWRQW